MAFDPHKNFATTTVATAPSPATTGLSLSVAAGEGALLPSGTFNATVWAANQKPTAANAEIVRATRTVDTLAIVRAQEGTVARSIVVGDQISAGITAKTITDIESSGDWVLVATQVVVNGVFLYDFLNLGGYTEVMVVIDDLARSGAVASYVQVSSNNGSSFLNTTADYLGVDTAGVETGVVGVSFFTGSVTAARSGRVHIHGFNVAASAPKVALSSSALPVFLLPTATAALNAVRVTQNVASFVSGTIYVWGRR